MVSRGKSEPVTGDAAKRAVLQAVKNDHRWAEAAIANRNDSIRRALEFGATWNELGVAMGLSRQAAHRRFNGAVKD